MAGKCLHPPCRCTITGRISGYCSDYCEENAKQATGVSCECGHDDCGE